MNPTTQAWTEIIFHIAYLVILWVLIFAMTRRQKFLQPKDRQIGSLFRLAFLVLALGDMAYVGLRALAFTQGQPIVGAQPGDTSLLAGLGVLAAAVAQTFFYILMAIIWRRRFKKPYGGFGIFIILAGFARLVLLALPQNQWPQLVPPQPWALYRDIPLLIQGVGVAFLFLRDSFRENDRLYKWIGVCILLALAFYVPAILLVQQTPLVGLLMIPEAAAYLAIAFLAYNLLFRSTIPRRKTA